jgi:glycosyltransferase involved in cell wall biosynthesis
MKVAALIPVYNEEERIYETLWAAVDLGLVDQIMVINDGSTDSTPEQVKRVPGVELLNLPNNVGKGDALNAGWQKMAADVYLLIDGDLGFSARSAGDLLLPVLQGQADMTVARFGQQQSSDGRKMGFGMVRRLASFGVERMTGEKLANPLSGQRAVRAEVLAQLGGFFPGYGVEIGLTVGALYFGFRIEEVPLPLEHRAYGRGLRGILHRGRQLMHVLAAFRLCREKGWGRLW